MESFSSKGIKNGLGIRGIIGAIGLGFICLYQPLFVTSSSLLWAKILLVLAAAVYVAFSIIWDRKFLLLTNVQLIAAVMLLGISVATGEFLFIALGLFLHAIWDLWHLATQKRYVPWWYAGACVYVDLAAVALILVNQ
ncbi:MAG: hypothetical protein EBW17_07450 [Actinobacteria bacterium]|jgi:hypothetical protein|nr:hypothetical protein [Actinomycetota bacterium]NCV42979.1 hypothetical protein [Actinomycetota bacterium]NCV82570.1 hypothetical protein [Actinomycetota bacterium]NCW42870.1 hypothetical protein [Actinomycetota bacterium]NCW92647.1 hypothetical protein [Actinomycetota bacterium]